MKFQSYTSTPGLERYPKGERFAVWQAAHKKLLGVDAQYRRRFYFYLTKVICLSCLLLPFYLPFFGIHLFSFPVSLFIILGMTAAVIFLAVRQMNFMNQQIGRYLQSSHDA